jgi:hypothetical protein
VYPVETARERRERPKLRYIDLVVAVLHLWLPIGSGELLNCLSWCLSWVEVLDGGNCAS